MQQFSRLLPAASLAAAAILDLPISAFNGYRSVQVDVGTPPKSHTLMFDTGSATSWIIDASCGRWCSNISGRNRIGYSSSESSTSFLTGRETNITYMGGSIAGPVDVDKWTVGGTSWDQPFIAADQSTWITLGADGFLGLAFASIEVAETTPIVETLIADGLLDHPCFGLYYGTETQDTTNGTKSGGVLTIGGSREAAWTVGDLVTVPLVKTNGQNDVWRVGIQGSTGSRSGAESSDPSTTAYVAFPPQARAVFDTGASSIALPDSVVDAVYDSIGMNYSAILSGKHIPLCSEFNDSWSVTFQIGDYTKPQTITVKGSMLALPGFAYRDDACWPPFDGGNSDNLILVGTRLLRNFYTVWDHGENGAAPSLSFGTLKNAPDWIQGSGSQ